MVDNNNQERLGDLYNRHDCANNWSKIISRDSWYSTTVRLQSTIYSMNEPSTSPCMRAPCVEFKYLGNSTKSPPSNTINSSIDLGSLLAALWQWLPPPYLLFFRCHTTVRLTHVHVHDHNPTTLWRSCYAIRSHHQANTSGEQEARDELDDNGLSAFFPLFCLSRCFSNGLHPHLSNTPKSSLIVSKRYLFFSWKQHQPPHSHSHPPLWE